MAEHRTWRDQRRDETLQTIKTVARRQMAEQGTTAISLRAIARDMNIAVSALYRYFPGLDDLLTALIVDNFTALAAALEAARDAHAGRPYRAQLWAVLLAYRGWAVTNPVDFQLIYGNPIPGYHAPREQTVPAVVRGFSVIVGLIEALFQAGEAVPAPPYDAVPPSQRDHIRAMIASDGYPVSELALYLGVAGWTRLHGIIMLELFNHLQPVIGDVGAYYRQEVAALFHEFGVKPPPDG
jgi:AcrR family transcriptional regulator